MTNGAATYPTTYDNVDVQQADFGIFLEVTSGLLDVPEARGVDVTIPGADGQVPRNRRPHRLALQLTGFVMGNGESAAEQRNDYQANVDVVRELFSSSREPAQLLVSLPDGRAATITARPVREGALLWNVVVPGLFAYLSVALESVDPDWVRGIVS